MEAQATARRVEMDFAETRALIARLDRDVSLLRNRSQISPKTRTRIDALSRQSAQLSASLPEFEDTATAYTSKTDEGAAQFRRGHTLFKEIQAAPLSDAKSALIKLTTCNLPPALERNIINLIADLDRHCAEMRHYAPSQGLPKSMQRLLILTAK